MPGCVGPRSPHCSCSSPSSAAAAATTPPPPPEPTSTDARTVAFTVPGETGETAAGDEAVFPATSPLEVIALAGARPDATALYDATDAEGSFQVEIARRGDRARVRVERDGSVTAVGIDASAGAIAFTCTGAQCVDGDPDGAGARALASIAAVLGGEALRNTFGALVALPADEVGVGQDTQAGAEVSCTAGSANGQDLRLCVTREGVITELTDGPTRLVATQVARPVAQDVARPGADDALGGDGAPLDEETTALDEPAATEVTDEGAAAVTGEGAGEGESSEP